MCKYDMLMSDGLFTPLFRSGHGSHLLFFIDVTQRNVLEVVFSRAEYWKCVSIGFVMPLGHYLYRHRPEQVVVLSSTIEGHYQPEDYN